jgi:hypothetical protein
MDTINWKVMEFEKKDRHPDWLWTVGLVSVIGAILCFFYGNIFFGIFLIIAGVVVIIHALHDPKELNVTINNSGVQINEKMFDYKKIKSFWLDESGKEDKLLLIVSGSFVPMLSIELFGVKAEEVRVLLSKYIKEEEMRESHSVALFDRLGF